jgi:hypothetical protein
MLPVNHFSLFAAIEGAFPMNPMSCKPIHVLQTNGLLEMSHIIQCWGTWSASVFTKKSCLFDFQPTPWLSLPFASGNVTGTTKDCILIIMGLVFVFMYQFVQNFGQIIVYYWSASIVMEPMNSVGSHGSLSVMKKVQMGWTFCERFS